MKTTRLSRSSDFSPQSAAADVRHSVSQSRKTRRWLAPAAFVLALSGTAPAQVPQLINYQGRVAVNNVNFDGTGLFRFSLVDGRSGNTYWSNAPDDDPVDGVPDAPVSLAVTKGLYSVLLGDATTPNMAVMPSTVFNNPDVRLRVWFDDGTANGSQLLSPDQRIAAVGYAMMAGNVPDAAITSAKLAAGAVGAAHIAEGAVGPNQLASGAVTGTKLADGAVGSSQLAAGSAAANLNASGQSGVAAGGMILSADSDNDELRAAGYVNLGQLNQSDKWYQKAVGWKSSARANHTAIWTGSEMIIWGGSAGTELFNTGGRYDPATDQWLSLPTAGAPSARSYHTAVWTGSAMIIWGGATTGANGLDSGGCYKPSAGWLTMSSIDDPSPRIGHTAVWTGREMLIWGGSYTTADGSSTTYYYNDTFSYAPERVLYLYLRP